MNRGCACGAAWRPYELSSDPKFVGKVRGIVGLRVNPPEHALVLPVDEKSQVQAPERTQPGLPMKRAAYEAGWR